MADRGILPVANFWEQQEKQQNPKGFFHRGDQREDGKNSSLFKVPRLYKEEDKGKQLNLGPGAGVGFGCGAGVGMGLTGGFGMGATPWNNIQLAFGVGVGCGIGIGYGYGFGHGIRWDKPPPPAKKRTSRVIVEM
eukprot:TRINITY_DN5782_c0_g3_i1.p2 TRINITY_DN5782_c0_g3~~TRINITY_DN5782_c0_g3_i1.p2  ORF type:complete len:135 (-),score=40.21 TRINITY_DN5782_c0_g3_i1:688-1092(-)